MIADPKRQQEFEHAYFVKLRRLPTIETQILECFRLFQEYGAEFPRPYTWNNIDLRRGQFRLYARSGFWSYDQQPLLGFAIETVEVKPRFQGRGWFRNISEIIYHTMPHDLLVVENVDDPALNQALRRKPDYHRFHVNCFARSELFSGGFDARLLRASSYRKFKDLGGAIKRVDYSPAISRHSADGICGNCSVDGSTGGNPLDWYGDCPSDAEPSPILQAIIAPHTLHGLAQRPTASKGTEPDEAE
jgi:hypothetical protein